MSNLLCFCVINGQGNRLRRARSIHTLTLLMSAVVIGVLHMLGWDNDKKATFRFRKMWL